MRHRANLVAEVDAFLPLRLDFAPTLGDLCLDLDAVVPAATMEKGREI